MIEPDNAFRAGCGFLGELACDGSREGRSVREVGLFWSEARGARREDTLTDLTWSFTMTDFQVISKAEADTEADKQPWPTEASPSETARGQAVFDLDPVTVKGGT